MSIWSQGAQQLCTGSDKCGLEGTRLKQTEVLCRQSEQVLARQAEQLSASGSSDYRYVKINFASLAKFFLFQKTLLSLQAE